MSNRNDIFFFINNKNPPPPSYVAWVISFISARGVNGLLGQVLVHFFIDFSLCHSRVSLAAKYRQSSREALAVGIGFSVEEHIDTSVKQRNFFLRLGQFLAFEFHLRSSSHKLKHKKTQLKCNRVNLQLAYCYTYAPLDLIFVVPFVIS